MEDIIKWCVFRHDHVQKNSKKSIKQTKWDMILSWYTDNIKTNFTSMYYQQKCGTEIQYITIAVKYKD